MVVENGLKFCVIVGILAGVLSSPTTDNNRYHSLTFTGTYTYIYTSTETKLLRFAKPFMNYQLRENVEVHNLEKHVI